MLEENLNKDGQLMEVREGQLMKVADYPKHEKNPFTDKFAMKVIEDEYGKGIKYARKDGQVISPNGEILHEGELILGKEYRVDRQKFIKVYVESLMMFGELSKRAVLLFTSVLQRLEKDKTVVYLVPQEITKDMDVSEPTYYRALSELLSARVLARHSASSVIYFINPAIMFNGDRMTVVARFVVDSAIEEKDDPQRALKKKNEDIEANEGFED